MRSFIVRLPSRSASSMLKPQAPAAVIAQRSMSALSMKPQHPLLVLSHRSAICARSFSVLGGFKDKYKSTMEARQQNKEAAAFEDQIELMLKHSEWSVKAYLEIMELGAKQGGATGWKSFVPTGGQGEEQKAQMKKIIEILKCMTPEEEVRARTGDLTGADRERLALLNKVQPPYIKSVMRQMHAMGMAHRWINIRNRNGQRMPSSQADMQAMMMAAPPKQTNAEKKLTRKLYRTKHRSQIRR